MEQQSQKFELRTGVATQSNILSDRVKEIMTPLSDAFMLEKSLRLNFQTMLAIYKSGACCGSDMSHDRLMAATVLHAMTSKIAVTDVVASLCRLHARAGV